MAKETPAFPRGEIGNNATDPSQQAWDRLLGRFAQVRLEFAEGQFDRIEVGRLLGEINQRCARLALPQRFRSLRSAASKSPPRWG